MRAAFVLLGLLVLLLVAAPADAAPSLKITSAPPKEAGPYTLVVAVAGFDLVDHESHANNRPGEGHIHYYLNGKPAEGEYATTATSFTYADLKKGDRVSAELVNNDHSSLAPPVIAKVRVPGDNGIPAPGAVPLLAALAAVALFVRHRTGP